MRKLPSNTCERAQNKEKEQAEDSSYPKGIEVMLRETSRKSDPDSENIDNPVIVPQDYEVRQSGRVLELRKQRFLDTTHRSFPALSYPCDCALVAL